MKPGQDTPSRNSVSPTAKAGHSYSYPGKHTQIFTKAELATLFGVRISELRKLARSGAFKRIGIDKYLLDCHQSVALLGRRDHPFHTAASTAEGGSAATAGQNGFRQYTGLLQNHDGLLENGINIVKVPDLQSAIHTAGMFLEEGLRQNERVVVLTFEHPDMLLTRLAEAGYTFGQALHEEQLIYLYYKPDVARSISLSMDYRELFGEALRFGGDGVRRVVLFNVDALINANSEHLVHASLHQLIYAANHYQVTLLGLFVDSGHVAGLLDEGCRAILPGYFVRD